jgi:hypothetical protein
MTRYSHLSRHVSASYALFCPCWHMCFLFHLNLVRSFFPRSAAWYDRFSIDLVTTMGAAQHSIPILSSRNYRKRPGSIVP